MSILGNHKAKLAAAAPCFTRTGKRQLEVEFEIVEGEFAGAHVGDFFGAEGKARPFLAENLRLCGWDGSKNLFPSCGTKIVEINIFEEEYQGQMNQRIRINRPRTVLRTKPGLMSKSEDRMAEDQSNDFLADLAGPAAREPGLDDDLTY